MATAAVTTEYCNLSLQELRESPTNPRQRFEENALKELAESIKTQGVLSPILVRPLPEGFQEHFEIVTGARRFRAAQLAGLDSVPVRIVNLSDRRFGNSSRGKPATGDAGVTDSLRQPDL